MCSISSSSLLFNSSGCQSCELLLIFVHPPQPKGGVTTFAASPAGEARFHTEILLDILEANSGYSLFAYMLLNAPTSAYQLMLIAIRLTVAFVVVNIVFLIAYKWLMLFAMHETRCKLCGVQYS